MGDTFDSASWADDTVALVDVAQADLTDVNGPDAVGDLLEADGHIVERFGEEEQAAFEVDLAAGGHAPHHEVTGVFNWRESVRVRARGRVVEGGWGWTSERLVGPLVIVEPAECREGVLLRGTVGTRRP